MASSITPNEFLTHPVISALPWGAKAILLMLWTCYFADEDRFLPALRTAEFLEIPPAVFDKHWPRLQPFFEIDRRPSGIPALIPIHPDNVL